VTDYKVQEVIELLVKNEEQLMSLVGNLKKAQDQARATKGEVVSLADVGGKLTGLGRGLATIGAGMTAAGAGGIFLGGKLAKGFIDAASEMDAYREKLRTLYKDEAAGDAALAWARRKSGSTPFEMSQVIGATVTLKQFGLDPKKYFGTVGDAAAMAAKAGEKADLEGLSLAFGKAMATGRLDEFGQRMGITADMLKKAGWSGKEGAKGVDSFREALVKVMEERAGGYMEKYATSLPGIMSNFRDKWYQFKATVGEGLLKILAKDLGALLEKLQDLSETGELEEWARALAEGIGGIYQALKSVAGAVWPVVRPMLGWLKEHPQVMKWVVLLGAVGSALLVVGGIVLTVAGGFLMAIGGLLSGIGAIAASPAAFGVVAAVIVTLVQAVLLIGASIASTVATLYIFRDQFRSVFEALLVPVYFVIGVFKTYWSDAVAIVKSQLLTLVVVLTGGVALAVVGIARHWDDVKATVAGVWKWISSLPNPIRDVGAAIVEFLGGALKKVSDWFVASPIGKVLFGLGGLVGKIGGKLGGWAGKMTAAGKGTVAGAAGDVASGVAGFGRSAAKQSRSLESMVDAMNAEIPGGAGGGAGGGGGGAAGGGGEGGGPTYKTIHVTMHFAPGSIVLKADDVKDKESIKKAFLDIAGAEALA